MILCSFTVEADESELAFHIVLVEPEIPPNTGNIGRLCLATGARLHLVGPLGFALDDRSLLRAGLDYWQHLDVRIWESQADFFRQLAPSARVFYFSTKAERSYWDIDFQRGDWLIFGSETRGLAESLLARNREHLAKVPMWGSEIRSLNLATAVGIVLYEGLRQIRL